jgi:hypothetical protein
VGFEHLAHGIQTRVDPREQAVHSGQVIECILDQKHCTARVSLVHYATDAISNALIRNHTKEALLGVCG